MTRDDHTTPDERVTMDFLRRFSPPRIPRIAALPISGSAYTRELISWALLAVALGALEGGVIGVICKDLFSGSFSSRTVNFSVALLTGAPHFCSLLSFFWARLARGRDVLRFLFQVQVATALCLLLVAAAPSSVTGLPMMVAGAVGARLFWAGVVTLRAPVWRRTYPRATRARLTGTFFAVHAVVMAATGWAVGTAVDWSSSAYHTVYAVAAVIGIGGAMIFRTLRVPEANSEPTGERTANGEAAGVRAAGRILREDPAFTRYLGWLSAAHSGNLMVIGPLIALMSDHLQMAQRQQVMVTSSIPLVLIPIAMPLWARLFDGGCALRFQAVNSATFSLAVLVLGTGAVSGQVAWLWAGAVLLGIAYAGGSVAWHLGTHHFAPRGRTLQYMGLHVSLGGVRGLLAPLAGMALYELVETRAPGQGAWVLTVPLFLCALATVGFARMASARPLAAKELKQRLPVHRPSPAGAGWSRRARLGYRSVALLLVCLLLAPSIAGSPPQDESPPEPVPTGVFMSIKTTPKYYATRTQPILATYWNLAPQSFVFFTDSKSESPLPWTLRSMDDPPLQEPTEERFNLVDTGCGGTRADLCCKTAAQIEYYVKHAMETTPWFCAFDDDTFVNVPRLGDYLRQFDPDAQTLYLGKRSTGGPVELRDPDCPHCPRHSFSFGTGGAGWCLSRALVRRGLEDFVDLPRLCEQIDAPDDVTIGYVAEVILGVEMTEEPRLHSHLESQYFETFAELRRQLTFGSGLMINRHVFAYYPGGSFVTPSGGPPEDPLGFRALYCELWPAECDQNEKIGR